MRWNMLPKIFASLRYCSLSFSFTLLNSRIASLLEASCSKRSLRSWQARSGSSRAEWACALLKSAFVLLGSISSALPQEPLVSAHSPSFSWTAALFRCSGSLAFFARVFSSSVKLWSDSMVDSALPYFFMARWNLPSLNSVFPCALASSKKENFSSVDMDHTSLAFSISTNSISYCTVVFAGMVASGFTVSWAPNASSGRIVISAFSPFFIFNTALSNPIICCSSSTTQLQRSSPSTLSKTVPSGSVAVYLTPTFAPSLGLS
mmetsp:Transcript_20256/g.28043  ORF Transcript_20256/g.28043 Transcript_20256/m.28043 type:complete len:262 (-) Transcript_20256:460-1245(-)